MFLMFLAAAGLVSAFGGEPPPPDYWTLDAVGGGIVHTGSDGEPVVLCMQGRKVVMQVRVDRATGFSYQARFFNVDPDLTKQGRVTAEVGADSNPALQVNGRPLRCEVPSAVAFDGRLTLVYPASEGLVTTRMVYPSRRNPVVMDEWQLRNATDQPLKDEMEGRYPTGTANLSTSSLAHGGYRLAARLAQSLGKPVGAEFDQRAEPLRKGIESYFGAEVEGFKTYRYYKENTTLRGWILLPLAMGITDRQEATVAALMSDKLWPHRLSGGDILAESTRPTEWGRETYYALRVLFKAGHTEEALDITRRVVRARIFGANGPYPDEDAIDMLCPGSLYPRVFTEGVFGIVPTGLASFECTPWLPKDWPQMALRDVCAFGRAWDLVVERLGGRRKVTVSSGGKLVMTGFGPAGKTYSVTFQKGNN